MRGVLTVILAGGRGTRLEPLTRDRAKPAVPFGGLYRIVDFTLSNCINSGLRKIRVLTQFKSFSLDRHIHAGWNFLSPELDESVEVLPPQQRIDETWYKGTADAIYQNIYSLEREEAENVLILAGDHIYKMDYGRMIHAHRDRGADVTIGCIPVPLAEVNQFGIMQAAPDDRVHIDPVLNLYDSAWPIRTFYSHSPPPKFVFSGSGAPGHARRGEALDSLVCPGCIVSGGQVRRSILSPRVRINSYAVVEDSILFDGVDIGRYCRVRRAIIDKDVKLPPYTVLGYDPEFDRNRGFTVTE